jgi:phosphatidylinositol alpha-1,6-mannosyltransferase
LFYGKDIMQAKRSFIRLLLLRTSIILTDGVATNSIFTMKLLKGLMPIDKKMTILYPGAYKPQNSDERQISTNKPYTILFVGRLVRRNGLEYLIRSTALLRTRFPDIRLVIVGNGPELSKMKELVRGPNISDIVEFTGELRGEELSRRYASSKLFVMPSVTLEDDVEGFGTVFLEAGLRGVPSVATFSGGIPEAVLNNVTGILVPEGDVVELTKAIETLLVDENRRRKMGEAARVKAIREFSLGTSAEKLLALFE